MPHDPQKILHHLGYEWWMFNCTVALLKTLQSADPTRTAVRDPLHNALVESNWIHERNLIRFFYVPEHETGTQKKKKKSRKKEWTCANVGIAREVQPQLLQARYKEICQRIAHMSRERHEYLTTWNPADSYDLLDERIKALRVSCAGLFPEPWIGDRAVHSIYALVSEGLTVAKRSFESTSVPSSPEPRIIRVVG